MEGTNGQIFAAYVCVLNETFNRDNYTQVTIFPVGFFVTECGFKKTIIDPHGYELTKLMDKIHIVERHVRDDGNVEEGICGYIETESGNGDRKAAWLNEKYANKWIKIYVSTFLRANANPENVRFRGIGIKIIKPQPSPPMKSPPVQPMPTFEDPPDEYYPPPTKQEGPDPTLIPGFPMPPIERQKEDEIQPRGKWGKLWTK